MNRKAVHFFLAAVAFVLLVVSACSTIPTGSMKAAVQEGDPAEDQGAGTALRTQEVFDKTKHKGKLTVRYLYLEGKQGTGDSIVIQSPDGKTMMIDSGIITVGPQVLKYLDMLGIQTIDIALNTHPHPDHIGGFSYVFANKEVKLFYSENLPNPESASYNTTMAQVARKNIYHRTLEEGDTFQLGSEVAFEVLSPNKGELPGNIMISDGTAVNNHSLVIKMRYKENSFLFTGDIYKERESELVEKWGDKLKADVLHAPHHGSTTSSTPKFANAVSPQHVVLSSNLFVSMETLKRYAATKVKAYSTMQNGSILLVSDGKDWTVVTEKDPAS
jgi:beta-lactamase superfamily II metal-dependent hydrolase